MFNENLIFGFTKFFEMGENLWNFHTVFSTNCVPVIFTVWKNETLTLTKKIFRQINSLVINRYFHEIFAKNACVLYVRVNFRTFHITVSHYGNFANSLPSCNFFRETICSDMVVMHIKNCYFPLIARHLRMIFWIRELWIRSSLTWNI